MSSVWLGQKRKKAQKLLKPGHDPEGLQQILRGIGLTREELVIDHGDIVEVPRLLVPGENLFEGEEDGVTQTASALGNNAWETIFLLEVVLGASWKIIASNCLRKSMGSPLADLGLPNAIGRLHWKPQYTQSGSIEDLPADWSGSQPQ